MSTSEKAVGKGWWRWLLTLGFFITMVGTWLWLFVTGARVSAVTTGCIGQNKMFGLAALSYDFLKKHYPAAYVVDAPGQPPRSWRAELLPQFGMQELYDQYHRGEPWNSPDNRKLAGGLPVGMSGITPMFHCATDRASAWLDTSYVMVVGPHTISPGPTGRATVEIPKGTGYTVLFAEMSESGIPWMEPRDLNFDSMSFKINDKQIAGIRSKHPGVAVVGMADGSVRAERKH